MPRTILCLPLSTSFSYLHANKILLGQLFLANEFRQVLGSASNVLWTLFLFTKSDFKTIILPVMACALASCPDLRLENLVITFMWTWLHLLQFCASNQTLSVDEDAANKPWRPVPSGRISLANAKALRWWLTPLCLVCSLQQGMLLPSIALNVMTYVHNELGFHSGWLGRNVCCALGYMAFEWGAICMASSSCLLDISTQNRSNIIIAVILSGILLITTIHAQDFKDVAGDRIHHRKTLPIAMPKLSRISLMVAMFAWSFYLPRLWQVDFPVSCLFGVLGSSVGLQCYLCRSVKADKRMYIAYNIWLGWALILPSLGHGYHCA
ncbi:hypothetical protein NEOLEDRAFT_1152282 [Neolentinus lepideus HHB14362 ss-1]|uniref:UbiA prenyltransferase n=1 Tax=Neolentinus lepideus HHB14362 ss-1 TaxID=1314782 RepID=A0A165MYK5_9AGAM|nr:hypothetical protein NEOLEDRAFT_1152282 [Neolentinus lepideus HHB14362 ss-1]